MSDDYVAVKVAPTELTFNTGAVRGDSGGKGRYDLLPSYAISRLAKHFENGAKVYAEENWRKGIPLRRYLDSALRHTFMYLEGRRDEDHASAAVWNMIALIETEEMIRRGILPNSLDNLPDWVHNFNPQLADGIFGESANADAVHANTSKITEELHQTAGDEKTRLETERLGQWIKNRNNRLDAILKWEEKAWAAPVTKMPEHDLDQCGTLDGKTPLPDQHFNDSEIYGGLHWILRGNAVYYGWNFDDGQPSKRFTKDELLAAWEAGEVFKCDANGKLLADDIAGVRFAEFDVSQKINDVERRMETGASL